MKVVVCFYEPKGNTLGDTEAETMLNFSHNVLPPRGESWSQEADNSLSWWFVILIFLCVGSVGGWRIYRRRVRRRRRRSSVKPGAGVRRVSGAKPGTSVKPAAGVKPTPSSKSATIKKAAAATKLVTAVKPAAGAGSAAVNSAPK